MDCNIEKAQELLKSGKATKEELEKVLTDIVDNYSTRPRIVIYLMITIIRGRKSFRRSQNVVIVPLDMNPTFTLAVWMNVIGLKN